MAICFPGMASRVKRAVTSAVRTAPWLTTRYWMAIKCDEYDKADNVVAADHKLAECLNHSPCRRCALVSVEQYAPGAGKIERQPHER